MRFIVVLLLLVSTASFAQKKKKDKDKEPAQPPAAATQQPAVQETKPAEPQQQAAADSLPTASTILTDHYLRKYSIATRWNDFEIAKDALYDIITENPGNDSIIFTLAYFYYEQQKFAPALLISQDLLQREPKNEGYLELAAVSAQSLGVYERALQHFESLYLLNDNIRTLYQIAFLQYNLKRYAECTNSINIILGRPAASTEKVVFNDAKGQQKEYLLKVAIINLKGLVALDQNDKVNAKKAFAEALALAPDFFPAKENIEKTK